MSDSDLLQKVTKGWKCAETPCGTGSTIAQTTFIRASLPWIADEYGIQSVADAGAGDLHWIGLVDWDVEYRPYDLYPRHADVTRLDITKEVLPKSDLILCRHVLNHLSIQYSELAIALFRKSGSKYLLMTNCDNQLNYWQQYGLSVGEPILTLNDTRHWRLELYEL